MSEFPLFTRSASTWSSPSKRNDRSMLCARLSNANFLDLVELSISFGLEDVSNALESIKDEIPSIQYRVEREMLDNISRGFSDA